MYIKGFLHAYLYTFPVYITLIIPYIGRTHFTMLISLYVLVAGPLKDLPSLASTYNMRGFCFVS